MLISHCQDWDWVGDEVVGLGVGEKADGGGG